MANLADAQWMKEDLTDIDSQLTKLDEVLKASGKYDLEGHSGQLTDERKIYKSMARIPCVKVICEIGFNGGHSAIAWLVSNSQAKVVMFDLWVHQSPQVGLDHILTLKELNSDRLTVVKGSSLETVKTFHAANPSFRCDLISIDGGHSFDTAMADVENMRFMSNSHFNILLIDDTNCGASYCVDNVVQEAERRNYLHVLEGISLDGNRRGVSVMTYLHHQN
jgi:hypothetical protein